MPKDDEVQPRRYTRPSTEVEQQAAPTARIQRSSLTFTVSAFLVICGSGGVIAEIFHTSQAFRRSRAAYSVEANRISGEASGRFWQGVSDALAAAEKDLAIATNKSQQIIKSGQAEVGKIEASAVSEGVTAQALAQIHKNDLIPRRDQEAYFNALRSGLEGVSSRLQADIKLLVTLEGDKGFSETFLSVPWDVKLNDHIFGISCIQIAGHETEACRPQLTSPVEVPGVPGKDTAPRQSRLEPMTIAERAGVGEYRRALEDLEEVLVYSALDMSRFRAGNQDVNRELSRVITGLQNVRQRFQQITEIEAIHVRSRREESLPAIEFMYRDLYASDLASGFRKDPIVGIKDWLREKPGRFLKLAVRDRETELNIRRSEFYQSRRPLLANVWATSSLGGASLLVMTGLRSPEPLAPAAPSGIFDGEEKQHPGQGSASNAALVISILLLGATAVGGFKLIAVASPKWRRVAMLSIAPLTIIGLAIPIQDAFSANMATESISSSLASEVLSTHLSQDYLQRGAEIARIIGVAGADRASAIEQSAEAERNRAVTEAGAKRDYYKGRLTLRSARTFMLLSDFREVEASCMASSDRVVQNACKKGMERARYKLSQDAPHLARSQAPVETFKY